MKPERYDEIVHQVRALATSVAGEGKDYLEAYVRASAWGVLHVLELTERGEPAVEAFAELEEQGRAVLETLDELVDQAQRRVLIGVLMASTRLLALAAAP